MIPKDLWDVKGIMCGGLDSSVYREKIKEFWGKYPLDIYAGTEGGVYATQTWDYDSMTFIPNLNFLEFIPEDEHLKSRQDPAYWPRTMLLDELKAGASYEVVISNFHGGARVRYRPGDMVHITARRNARLGIETPQMVFQGRADDIIDFGVTRLTEKVIWQAVENTHIPYEDWVARKEVNEGMRLHLFVEPKHEHTTADELRVAVDQEIRRLDESFVATHGDVGNYLNFSVDITLLPRGAFNSYKAMRRSQGAEPAHLKPAHVNPPDQVITQLMGQPQPVAPPPAPTPQPSETIVR